MGHLRAYNVLAMGPLVNPWSAWMIHWVGMDFVPYWVGVRSMLIGQSPYSAGTTHLIQATLLGGPPGAGGKSHAVRLSGLDLPRACTLDIAST